MSRAPGQAFYTGTWVWWQKESVEEAGVFSLIIFSSLLTDGYQNKMESPQLHCILNSNNVACSFAVVAGFLAFFSCLAFLVLDTQETHIADTRFKTAFQLLDLILADIPGLPGIPGPPK
ncbi:synaptogyrin-4 isoform X6 [Macaca fascicularis]|uniref:synaptogyrin-4 isoform X6 n=1 Tax=Macaca fascicularis TaxID=9541 RepID=UPI003D1580AD